MYPWLLEDTLIIWKKTVEKENFDQPIIQEVRRRGRPRNHWNDPNAKHFNKKKVIEHKRHDGQL